MYVVCMSMYVCAFCVFAVWCVCLREQKSFSQTSTLLDDILASFGVVVQAHHTIDQDGDDANTQQPVEVLELACTKRDVTVECAPDVLIFEIKVLAIKTA